MPGLLCSSAHPRTHERPSLEEKKHVTVQWLLASREWHLSLAITPSNLRDSHGLQFPKGSRHLSEAVERTTSPKQLSFPSSALNGTHQTEQTSVMKLATTTRVITVCQPGSQACPEVTHSPPRTGTQRVLTTELQVGKGTWKCDVFPTPRQKRSPTEH